MLVDSFVATGYKYGVISYPKDYSKLILPVVGGMDEKEDFNDIPCPEASEKPFVFHSECIVPFQDVFGLTLGDLKAYSESLLYQKKFLFFVMYDSIHVKKDPYMISYKSDVKVETCVRYVLPIDVTCDEDMMIDEYIYETFQKTKHLLNQTNQNRACAFMELVRRGIESSASNALEYIKK